MLPEAGHVTQWVSEKPAAKWSPVPCSPCPAPHVRLVTRTPSSTCALAICPG